MLNKAMIESTASIKIVLVMSFICFGLVSCIKGADSYASNDIDTPTVFISASQASIGYNKSASITWSSNKSTSCTSSPSGITGVAGTYTTPGMTDSTTYTVMCAGAGGSASASVKLRLHPAR
jgi:hypothetical protein